MFEKFKSSQISKKQQMFVLGGDKENPDKDGGNNMQGTCPDSCGPSSAKEKAFSIRLNIPDCCSEKEEIQ